MVRTLVILRASATSTTPTASSPPAALDRYRNHPHLPAGRHPHPRPRQGPGDPPLATPNPGQRRRRLQTTRLETAVRGLRRDPRRDTPGQRPRLQTRCRPPSRPADTADPMTSGVGSPQGTGEACVDRGDVEVRPDVMDITTCQSVVTSAYRRLARCSAGVEAHSTRRCRDHWRTDPRAQLPGRHCSP